MDYDELDKDQLLEWRCCHLRLSKGVGFEEICVNMIKDISTDEYLDEYPEVNSYNEDD